MSNSKLGRGPPQRRRHYSVEYKRKAVELTLRGDRPMQEIARELGINAGLLGRWRTELRDEVDRPERSKEELERENHELRTRLAEMEEREQVLKKSLGI